MRTALCILFALLVGGLAWADFDEDTMLATQPVSGGGETPTVNDFTNGMLTDLWLDGGYTDASTNGNNGTAVGTPTFVNDKNGLANHAVNLNGTNQGISSALNLGGANAATVMFWLKLGTVTAADNVVAEYSTNYNVANAFMVDIKNSGVTDFEMHSTSFPGNNGGTIVTPPAGTWIHIAAVFNRSATSAGGLGVTVYTNAVATTVTQLHSANCAEAFDASLGINWGARNSSSLWVPCTLDDVRVYNSALSQGQIAQVYTNSPRGP